MVKDLSVEQNLVTHPYWWALGLCLLIDYLFSGSTFYLSKGGLYLEILSVFIGITGYLLWRYKSERISSSNFVLCEVLTLVLGIAVGYFYPQATNKTLWQVVGGGLLLLWGYGLAYKEEYKDQLNAFLIMGLGFFVKLYYVLLTPINNRQYDVCEFGKGWVGHAGYIDYFLKFWQLPDFDVRKFYEFYHPPLHHFLSAVWIYIHNKVFFLDINQARESLQDLTLFYSLCTMIAIYQIFRYFELKGLALYVPLFIINFHPAFIRLSASINNDILSIALMHMALLCTLKWYRSNKLNWMVKSALCVGLGMMTKLSAVMVILPIILLFIFKLKKHKIERKLILKHLCIFFLICLPLGSWFGARNYLKWHIPFTYIRPVSIEGDKNAHYWKVVTDFSKEQWSKFYRGTNEECDGDGWCKYNPLIIAMKTAIFGEHIESQDLQRTNRAYTKFLEFTAFSLLWLNIWLNFFFLVAIFQVLFHKEHSEISAEKIVMAIFHFVLFACLYKLFYEHPFACSADFRYITPTLTIGSLFIGLWWRNIKTKGLQIITLAFTVLFVVASVIICSAVCYWDFNAPGGVRYNIF